MDAVRLDAVVVGRAWVRPVNAAMFLMFLACAFVQYNDSDWMFWVLLYVASAGFCLGRHMGLLPRWSYWGFSFLVVCVAAYWVLGVPSDTDLMGSLTDMDMVHRGSERIREVGGLILVGLWMLVLGVDAATGDVAAQ